MSFFAARKPAFDPPPKPRFSGSARHATPSGNASRTNSALPSVEPLSTTMTSLPGCRDIAATTEGRYFSSRSRPFQFGITTEALDVFGRVSGDKAFTSEQSTRIDPQAL